MATQTHPATQANLSIVHGPPLSEEPGLGALTIGGYAREVTTRHGEREALVFHGRDGVVRWSYTELWRRSLEVARALIAAGVDKDTRVGVLLTNRPEYMSLVFGIALAGGVSVPLNTFSTRPELEALLRASNVSLLVFERQIANKDFAGILSELEPQLTAAEPGRLRSRTFPFLRRAIMLDDAQARPRAVESYGSFLRDGDDVYRTWHTDGRGTEQLSYTFALVDLLPWGRQEEWQDSPEGWPQSPTYSGWLDAPDVARRYGPDHESS